MGRDVAAARTSFNGCSRVKGVWRAAEAHQRLSSHCITRVRSGISVTQAGQCAAMRVVSAKTQIRSWLESCWHGGWLATLAMYQ